MNIKIANNELFGLDFLRFLLSITILIVHFPHFFNDFGITNKNVLPFDSVLGILYKYGGFAVEIFWMISGVIFFNFYHKLIVTKGIDFITFMYLRVSRLYPLHLFTLVSVGILQYFYFARFGKYFIYQNNDAIHFILNLFMINFWNPKFGLSFNGPFWSVSVEIFVYIIFYFLAFSGIINNRRFLLISIGIYFIFYCLGILSPFYECFLFFFIGGLLTYYFNFINFYKLILLFLITLSTLFIWKFFQGLNLIENFLRIINCIVKISISITIILFFSKSFLLVTNKVGKILRELGNMTYSIYMIHISLQIIFILFFYEKGIAFFSSNSFFFVYISMCCLFGWIFYRFYELPLQFFLRKLVRIIN